MKLVAVPFKRRIRAYCRIVGPVLESLEMRTLLNGTLGGFTMNVANAAPSVLSGRLALPVQPYIPVVTETPSTTQVSDGAPVTFSVSVTALDPGLAQFPITGTVTFLDGSVPVGTAVIDDNVASAALNLPLGLNFITARYEGDANFASAASAESDIWVSQYSSHPTLAVVPQSPGSPNVDLRATVTTSDPTDRADNGGISYYDGGRLVGEYVFALGSGDFEVTNLTPGEHKFYAVINPSDQLGGSSSSTIDYTVSAYTASISIQATPTTISEDRSIALEAAVNVMGVAPTGSVTFSDGPIFLGTAPVASDGSAILQTSFATPGVHNITVSYSGDSDYTATTSQAFSLTVTSATVIDLLGLYSTDTLTALGSQAAVIARIAQAVDDTNTAMANSDIPVVISLVGTQAVNYTFAGSLNGTLTNLYTPTDGVLDQVQALRDQYAADLVTLFVGSSDTVNSTATSQETGISEELVTPGGNADTAYSVVAIPFAAAPYYTLAHELGHSLGAEHDTSNSTSDGLEPYSHGYRFVANGVTYHDIMSYAPGTTIPYYSNPNVSYLGVPTGNTTTSNIALLFSQTAPEVAAYRNSFSRDLVISDYQNIFNRVPDDGGMDYWVGLLNNNSITPAGLSAALTGSLEYRTDEIEATYQSILDRAADPVGLAFWTGQLADGATISAIASGFYGSQEYAALHAMGGGGQNVGADPAAFVTDLYQSILNRAPDAAGLDYWTGQLTGGLSTANLATDLLQSAEFAAMTINGYYLTYLHRNADAEGLAYFTGLFEQGVTSGVLVQFFLTSTEYLASV